MLRSLEREGGCPGCRDTWRAGSMCSPEQSPLERLLLWLCGAAQPCSLQCLSDLLPSSCSGMAAGVAFHLSHRNQECTVYLWNMYAMCLERSCRRYVFRLIQLWLFPSQILVWSVWQLQCLPGNNPQGCQLLPVFLCFSEILNFCHWKKSLVAWQRDTSCS